MLFYLPDSIDIARASADYLSAKFESISIYGKGVNIMTNLEKYTQAFSDTLGVSKDEVEKLEYRPIRAGDSAGHMELVAAIEDTFDIMMDTDDIIDFNSFEKGKEILSKNYSIGCWWGGWGGGGVGEWLCVCFLI